MELTERLRAALDETERVAREADGGSWVVGPTFGGRDNRVYVKPEGFGIDTIGTCVIAGQVANMPGYRANAEHIALHDPERELRMVAAHRKILDEHPARERRESWDEYRTICATCTYDSGTDVHEYPCPTVTALAEAYGVEA